MQHTALIPAGDVKRNCDKACLETMSESHHQFSDTCIFSSYQLAGEKAAKNCTVDVKQTYVHT